MPRRKSEKMILSDTTDSRAKVDITKLPQVAKMSGLEVAAFRKKLSKNPTEAEVNEALEQFEAEQVEKAKTPNPDKVTKERLEKAAKNGEQLEPNEVDAEIEDMDEENARPESGNSQRTINLVQFRSMAVVYPDVNKLFHDNLDRLINPRAIANDMRRLGHVINYEA